MLPTSRWFRVVQSLLNLWPLFSGRYNPRSTFRNWLLWPLVTETKQFMHQSEPICRLHCANQVHLSDVVKPLHLKEVFGRKYRFQHVDFCQVAEAPRKFRGRGFSFMYSRKLRGRATIQSRKQFPARAEAKTNFNPISQSAQDAEAISSSILLRKEPFMPRKLRGSLRGRDLIFLFGRNWV